MVYSCLFSLGSVHLFSLSWSFSFFLFDFSQLSGRPWLAKYWNEDLYGSCESIAPQAPPLRSSSLEHACASGAGQERTVWSNGQLPQWPKLMGCTMGWSIQFTQGEPVSCSPSPFLSSSLLLSHLSSFFSLLFPSLQGQPPVLFWGFFPDVLGCVWMQLSGLS